MKKFLLALAFAAFAVQSPAVEFNMGPVNGNLYGELYLNGFYEFSSQDYNLVNEGRRENNGRFDVDLETRSLIGVELQFGKLGGVFEVGADMDEYLRLYYVYYDFGKAGVVSFGKQATIANYSFGQEALEGNALIDYGAANDFRLPMLMYSVAGFQIAVIHSGDDRGLDELGLSYENGGETLFYETKRKQYLPRFEAAYTYSNDFLEAKIYGSYAHYSEKVYGMGSGGGDRSFDSSLWLVGLGGTYNVMNGFIQVGAFYGSNLYLGDVLTNGNLSPWYNAEKDEMEEVISWGFAVGIGYTFAEKFTPQLGFGYQSSDSEGWDKNDKAMGAYFNVICQFNEYIAVIPEVSWLDDMTGSDGINEGYRIYAGLIAKVTF